MEKVIASSVSSRDNQAERPEDRMMMVEIVANTDVYGVGRLGK